MKKYIHTWFIPILFLTFTLGACDDYLDVKPKGVTVLETTTDFDQWLNSNDLETCFPQDIIDLEDNVDFPYMDISQELSGTSNYVYTWASQYSIDVDDSPVIWSNFYKTIYLFNTVLEEINDATVGTEQEKKRLKAEALLGRAFDYLYLVNLYGKPYDANTATEDMAVPFVTSNDLNIPIPDRSTVQEIYDHIITDVNTAIPDLPQDNSVNRYRGSVAGGYSVLARTYLFMGDYTRAAQNAQLAIDNCQDTILNYSAMESDEDIPVLNIRPGAIYARHSTSSGYYPYPTLNFLNSFDTLDFRLDFYYSNLGDYSFTTRGQVQYNSYGQSYRQAHPNWGTSVAEMHLILAEVAARTNNLTEACDQLDLLRKNRFPEYIIESIDETVSPPDTTFSYKYEKFESTNQEEVLQRIITERSFEFPFMGMRWFDMRRLDRENRMPAAIRYDRDDNIITTLSPGSLRYTLQIPMQIMAYHPDWVQNPWEE